MKLVKVIVFITILFAALSANAEKLIVRMRSNVMTFNMQTNVYAELNKNIFIVEGNYESLSRDPRFLYVEKDQTIKVDPIRSTDPVSSESNWGLEAINVQKMWHKGIKGQGIKIAVIDTGVDAEHPELAGRVLPGWDAIKDEAGGMDDQGHGTHCAGTVAGATVGVAPEAQIIPVKFLDAQGSGTLSDALEALQWAIEQDVDILSNSWGGGGYSQAMQDVILAAKEKGIVVIAAAGNESSDNDKRAAYPANYDHVISVAASDKNKGRAWFSNWGKTKVLLAAPGVGIYSSIPGGKYQNLSGTSMAAPHVSGAAALLLQDGCEDIALCLQELAPAAPSFKNRSVTEGILSF